MYRLHSQHLDLPSGFHIAELRDEQGHRHLIQLSVGDGACPACGTVHPKHLEDLDPAAAIAGVVEALNASQERMLAYARKHRLTVK